MSTLKVNDIEEATSGGGKIWPSRAWANINQANTQVIRDDRNVSSITDAGTGQTTLTWSNGAPNANYAMPCAAADSTAGAARFCMPADGDTMTTSSCKVAVENGNSTASDTEFVHVSAIWV